MNRFYVGELHWNDEIIETYWNVNRDSEKSATALFEGNNRNILEIYWNVNCRD